MPFISKIFLTTSSRFIFSGLYITLSLSINSNTSFPFSRACFSSLVSAGLTTIVPSGSFNPSPGDVLKKNISRIYRTWIPIKLY